MTDPSRRTLRRLLPRRIRRSYAATFGFVLLAVTLCTVLVGATVFVHAGDVLERDTQSRHVANAEIQASELDAWFSQMRVQVQSLSEAAAFDSTNRSQVSVYLWDVVQRDDDISAAYYVDTANGSVVTSAGSTAVASASSVTRGEGRARFTEIARQSTGADDVVVSRPFRTSANSSPVVLFAARVPKREGRAVVAVVDLSAASDRHLHHIDEGRFVVVDETGTVVMAEDEERILETDRLRPAVLRNRSGHRSTTVEGEATEVGYAHLGTNDWVVTSRVPASRAYALRGDILAGFAAVLASVLLGAALLAATVGRDTMRSVRALSTHARELTNGDLDTRVETERTDEFGDLFEAFDAMRRSLRAQIREAEAAREDAEAARQEALAAKAQTEAFSRHLERTAAAYGEVMRDCADGDLTRRIEPDERSEAMATIANSFNEMMADVHAQNERLETVSHVLSHDLRNPLNVAVGRGELLAEEAESTHVEPILSALDRMDAIIDDALLLAMRADVEDASRVELGSHAESAWRHVETGDATLEVRDDTAFEADSSLLGHVFENLFRNSVEHGSTSSRPEDGDAAERGSTGDDGIAVRVGALDSAAGGGFYVEDDGPGIPESDREAVVEPGYTTNRENGGTGLGLSIVTKVAAAHGWDLRVTESDEGGARFEFAFGVGSASDAPPVDTASGV